MSNNNKRVCVIGAGLSGLVTTKELRAAGLDVTCYEMMPILSGVFGSHTWKDGRLTSSNVNTFFSDFPVKNRQHFMDWREFCDYLEDYTDHFGFRDCIKLNSKINSTEQVEGGWLIKGERGNFSNGHQFHPAVDVQPSQFEEHFTHLVICSGLSQNPKYPDVPGLASFTGQTLHSSEFRDAEDFSGDRALIVGGGESGSDIAGLVAPHAKECTISIRSSTGTLFPKWIQGNTPDIRDDRITYNLPRAFKQVVRRGHFRFYGIQKETPELFEWARQYNYSNNRCSFNSQACKSFGLPEAIVNHGARLTSGLTAVAGKAVMFNDGTQAEVDKIIYCTGFKPRFPFLPDAVTDSFGCISKLWKNMLPPKHASNLAFIGFARPHHINFLTCSELQARTLAALLSGYRQMPSEQKLTETVKIDRAFMKEHYADRAEANPALVDHTYYTEGLAHFLGCNVPWLKVLRKKPKMLTKLLYSALHGAHHRLQGPGENWDLAVETIMATPRFNNKRNARFRWVMLSTFTLFALLASVVNPKFKLMSGRMRKQAKQMQ